LHYVVQAMFSKRFHMGCLCTQQIIQAITSSLRCSEN